jgi:putative Mg2+ transporter-C (MgtC) family protein
MMYDIQDIIGILLATVLGSVIGWERQRCGKAAGIRTNVLICLGAAVFAILSKYMAGADGSAGRVAAQVVSGVGFLGAGAIIQDRGGVHGLTTAATIWLVASIGVACGCGYYVLAGLTTVIALSVLVGVRALEKLRPRKKEGESL